VRRRSDERRNGRTFPRADSESRQRRTRPRPRRTLPRPPGFVRGVFPRDSGRMNTLAVRFASQLDDALFEILHGCQIVGLPPAGSGKWSATDNLAHLGRYHEVFAERLGRMLREDAPEFARYRADGDAGVAAWRCVAVNTRLRQMR